ncbi:MAG: pyridoxamine 5'-phosphate oxidase family protein [Candidatus Dormibacteraeota bacterium]|nr:pyridoxamine 5'-phosphate oxidase family protein [Candidatus Dormibacteraeota bacterium]
MSRWEEVVTAEPAFADRVLRIFDQRKHKTLATLRADGSPRISGIEAEFVDGDVWLGMMPDSLKLRDLQRDPRLALHATSDDPPADRPSAWLGDAKLSGRAVAGQRPDLPAPAANWFRIDLNEVVLTYVSDPPDFLVVESWHAGRGLERLERK